MKSQAVVIEAPNRLAIRQLSLVTPVDNDLLVSIDYSGISTGTERLLFEGRMPHFPGMGYPLVPGYESVGQVIDAGTHQTHWIGERVFVPGSQSFVEARGLFGGAARRLVVPAKRVVCLAPGLTQGGHEAVLLALAATACHALLPDAASQTPAAPDLIVGHGVVGRLLARLTIALGEPAPTVWETQPARQEGASGYRVLAPADDTRTDYARVIDASGDINILDTAMRHLARGGEIVLAGFYAGRLAFDFAPAFVREARVRIAAEWQGEDMARVQSLLASGRLSLADLITHRHAAGNAADAYRRAFDDPASIKTILDWRDVQ